MEHRSDYEIVTPLDVMNKAIRQVLKEKSNTNIKSIQKLNTCGVVTNRRCTFTGMDSLINTGR